MCKMTWLLTREQSVSLACPLKSYLILLEMKVIADYLLAVLGGNTSPSAEDLKEILGSVVAEADDDRIEFLLSEVKGKYTTELIITSAREKFASVPAGCGIAVAAAAPAAPAVAETEKEEKVEEQSSDEDMGFSLFD